ncbi:PREDICTED: uncharacterized protein LOC109348643 isoform X2 [Lupinus angustifolius]|uniref:uncharacterized protein LOC109348643 isoform X2 n=1 Tax=Lupinus angustifolius TaxID=3871 RepID=UPI00092E7438|nr:PREDICTED: uncharacterized protein LOC109348643 isoform X2 [Lupinus angustifolius]
MVEDTSFFCNKDILIAKPPKKSRMLLRTAVLMFLIVCSVFIFSVCLKQISTHARTKFLELNVVEKPSQSREKLIDIPYLHYPIPVSFSRNECAHNSVLFFAILSNQRSGSGWFETLLNSHINVSSNGEGLMEHHKEIAEYFNRRRVSVIFLFRRNLLRRIVSLLANSYDSYAKLLNGTHKSHVHSAEEADILSKYKPTINSTSLLDDLKDMEIRAAKALEYFNSTRHMILYYEDLVRNPNMLKDVQEFLGLPPMELTSRQVKIHRGPLSDHIQNWDDVRKTLNGTDYESFLEADY